MSALAPSIPDNAPFTPEQRAWLNGFFAGLFSRQPGALADAGSIASPAKEQPLTILWGSQTGTAESLAKKAAKAAGQRGFAATVLDMAGVDLAQLATSRNVLVITSTYGDGEPPDNAKALHQSLLRPTEAGALLAELQYSVCALGDTNYTLFCQCGKDFDDALEKHGAVRVAARVDCDLDYEEAFARWLDAALTALGSTRSGSASSAPVGPAGTALPGAGATALAVAPVLTVAYSKTNPFPAPVRAVRPLNGPGSAKEVNHVEFSLGDSGLSYEAGDALAVVPQNCPILVDEVLTLLGCDGEEPVNTAAGERPLRTALLQHFDLAKPSTELLRLLGIETSGTPPLHVIDALLATGARRPTPADFSSVMRKLQPRLYSISSSPKAHPGEVHLTVGAVRYEANGRARKGVCSTFLAERAVACGTVGVYVHANKNFRPPADPNAPMIMIGPGTGIAPFRAFLEERAATNAGGRNWLFFGDQRASTDFLYRDELEQWQRSGLLTRLDTAFSRDQAEKIYVQHRLLEHAAEAWSWLEQGAHVYVCGDASRMAKDVDAALLQVVQRAGGRSPAQAEAYVQALRTTKRYARDVY
ncbi:MAG TPA: sulfite reductase subunit alpha [Candidatus Synoicihabitans sp.]|nr:sulfite reductase subunit alpha [Candidatus Synoicihabitans sp.]